MVAPIFAHGPVAASIYKPSFDPLVDLPGLIWFLHPDDATDVIGGEINSLTDRVAAATFTAPAAANRMPLDTNNERPGHNAAQTATLGADLLRSNDAGIAAALNGTPGFTVSWLGRRTSNNAIGMFQVSNNSGFFTGADRISVQLGQTACTLIIGTAAAQFSSWSFTVTGGIQTWRTYSIVYDGAGVADLYIDGALHDSDTQTHRATTNLLYTFYCAGQGYMGPACICDALDAATVAQLHTWLADAANA